MDATVYQCPECEERYLGEHVFCRRLGVGGSCPNCDEAVAVMDLMGDQAMTIFTG